MDTTRSAGTLWLVATPIGNMDDITIRALNVLKEADIIAAEDTRRAHNLLTRHNISGPRLVSYHAFNERRKTDEIIGLVASGSKVALVTDAGTPCVSDPGFLIVREALKAGIEPVVIPGPSSLTFAIAASGLPSDKFVFYGFLPVKKGRRDKALAAIAAEDKSVVVFESPFRIAKLINELLVVLPPETDIAVIREATKIHEETIRGKLSDVAEKTKDKNWKGEIVLIIGKRSESDPDEDEQIEMR